MDPGIKYGKKKNQDSLLILTIISATKILMCNPAPADGSAPNLVIEGKDEQGKPCFRHAFNTQARFYVLFDNGTWLTFY